MDIYTTYSAKIKHYSHIFTRTAKLYREAVDFFIRVLLENRTLADENLSQKECVNAVEALTVTTKKRTSVPYDFGRDFYKFPCYLRRAAIASAIGKVSSYLGSVANWEAEDPAKRGKRPGLPKAGNAFPSLYKGNMYEQLSCRYLMNIKVFCNNTWDWLTIKLRKSDVDYIARHCKARTAKSPVLQKRGKEWFIDFPFEEKAGLSTVPVEEQVIIAVDLGINNACTCTAMKADGTVAGRHFLKLPAEYDSLSHALNRIRKAQQHGAYRMPRLWAKAKGINDSISVKTAQFIMDTAVLYNADVVVFEHLDLRKKKRGSGKQKLHMWRAQYVQSMVMDKAHRLGMRVSRVCARGTSRLAFDGSGTVSRGKYSDRTQGSYSVCEFSNGKVYNCDLNAAYNIGARYFIREILKSVDPLVRLELEAKVPQASRRSTCTLSTLISLYAGLSGAMPASA